MDRPAPASALQGPLVSSGPTRRTMLTLGAQAVASGVISSFLPGFSETEASPIQQIPQVAGQTRNLILVIFTGGLSSLDSFDYRPDAPSKIRGPFSGILTHSRQSFFGQHFPRMARIDDQFAMLTAMQATSHADHGKAYKDWLTLNEKHIFSGLIDRAPGLKYVNGVTPGVRPKMDPERAELLLREAIQVLWDEKSKDYLCDVVTEAPPNLDERMRLRSSLNRESPVEQEAIARFEQHYRNAYKLLANGLFDAFRSTSPAETAHRMERYGDNPYGRLFSLAGQLADPDKGNVKLVVIETGEWDHHWDTQEKFDMRAPHMDQAFAALILEYRNKIVIAGRGEFGRTALPEVDRPGSYGRSHDPRHTAILAGPTVRAGARYGKSDFHKNQAEIVSDRDFADTVYVATGDRTRLQAPDHVPQVLRLS